MVDNNDHKELQKLPNDCQKKGNSKMIVKNGQQQQKTIADPENLSTHS